MQWDEEKLTKFKSNVQIQALDVTKKHVDFKR